MNIGRQFWDNEIWNGEQPFQENGIAEAGNDTEMALWGFTMGSLVGESIDGISKELETNSLIVKGLFWPDSNGRLAKKSLRTAQWAYENHGRPIPMDHIARLFTEQFWKTDFVQYGHSALKNLPFDREHKFIRHSSWYPPAPIRLYLGKDEADFVLAVIKLFRDNGYPTFSTYLKLNLRNAMRTRLLPTKWTRELTNWSKSWCVLDDPVNQLLNEFEMGISLNDIRTGGMALQMREYNAYLGDYMIRASNNESTGFSVDFNTWRCNVENSWARIFKIGGTLMFRMAEVYRLMDNDISFLQGIILDYLGFDQNVRRSFYSGGGANDPTVIGSVHGRALGFFRQATKISQVLDLISAIPQLTVLQADYTRWGARFRATAGRYHDLLRYLAYDHEYRPDDWRWKARMHALPSSSWRKEADMIKLLAHQQYERVDPRIRDTLDRAAGIIGDESQGGGLFPPPADADELKDLVRNLYVENKIRIDAITSKKQPAPSEDIEIPDADPPPEPRPNPGGPKSLWASFVAAGGGNSVVNMDASAAPTVAPEVIPGANNGITFGQPTLRGLSTGVRFTVPSENNAREPQRSTEGARSGQGEIPARRDGNATANPLGVQGGRVSKPDNPLPGFGFRNHNIRSRGWRFDTIAGENNTPFGTVSPPASKDKTLFPPTAQTNEQQRRAAFKPFVHPYAVPRTISADVENYREDVDTAVSIKEVAYEMSPYTTTETYREMGIGVDLDLDSSPILGGSP